MRDQWSCVGSVQFAACHRALLIGRHNLNCRIDVGSKLVFNHGDRSMDALISDTTSDARISGLEDFLQRYLGQRRPEFGASADELQSIEMPAPLRRFFGFAGQWPGHNPQTPFMNRFCMQDKLCALTSRQWAPVLQDMDNRLVFVWENQGVWVAATEHTGDDPPVWITEKSSHRETQQVWRRLEKPLSHFLVSFVLQELIFGSELLAAAADALEKFEQAGLPVRPVWVRGEYAWDIDRPSYFLVDERFLVRRAPDEGDGEDWYGCAIGAGMDVLRSLGLPSQI